MKVVPPHNDNFAIDGSTGPVRLAISFGDGQTGTSIVLSGGSVLAAGANLDQVLLGNAEELTGKSIVVRSTVSQGNSSTPHFSVVHDVSANATHERFIVADIFDAGVTASITETIAFK